MNEMQPHSMMEADQTVHFGLFLQYLVESGYGNKADDTVHVVKIWDPLGCSSVRQDPVRGECAYVAGDDSYELSRTECRKENLTLERWPPTSKMRNSRVMSLPGERIKNRPQWHGQNLTGICEL